MANGKAVLRLQAEERINALWDAVGTLMQLGSRLRNGKTTAGLLDMTKIEQDPL